MRNRTIWGATLAAILSTGIVFASENSLSGETKSSTPFGGIPTIQNAPTADLANLFRRQGLFDSDKISSWKTYSFGMAVGGGRTTSGGLLVQHMQYRISKPLTLHMAVGLEHDPVGMAGFNTGGPRQANLTIPSIDLIYRPSESMVFAVHYSQIPRSNGGFGSQGWERGFDSYTGAPRW